MQTFIENADQFVKSGFSNSSSDKYVNYGVYIPYNINFGSKYFETLTTNVKNQAFVDFKQWLTDELNTASQNTRRQELLFRKLIEDITASKN